MKLEGQSPRVVIVGAGMSGLSMAVTLKTKLKFDDFVIYEKASSIGGSWRDNTYPGCGSDVAGHWYSLSSELYADWENHYPTQPEIREYWARIFDKHNLAAHTVFNTTVVLSAWDEHDHLHTLTLVDACTAETRVVRAEIVVSAVGFFQGPRFPPDVRGMEKFAGPLWHSLRWRHDVDLAGKRVGVIGNGCSAAQFVPIIAGDPSTEVINFCRSPQWYVMRNQFRYPHWVKWAFSHVPYLMQAYRNSIMLSADLFWYLFKRDHWMAMLGQKRILSYMESNIPAEHIDKMIPSYPPGCKRIILDPGYLAALHRPNVTLKWDRIEEIVEDGILLSTGEKVALDVIIFATGFYLEERELSMHGLGGRTLTEYFESEGGPIGYRGSVFPGFPNVFMLVGPNSSSHSSLFCATEIQIGYILQLMQPLLTGDIKVLHVKPAATARYNEWLAARMRDMVFMSCLSYYRGDTRSRPRNITVFPGTMVRMWWDMRKPRWEDFEMDGAEQWVHRRWRKEMGWQGVAVLVLGAAILLRALSR